MSECLAYDRILAELRETRGVLDEHLRPSAKQVVHAEIAQLVDSAREWHARLRHSSAEIDHSLDACRRHWSDIERAREELAAINAQLLELGQEAAFNLDEFVPLTNFATALISRLSKK